MTDYRPYMRLNDYFQGKILGAFSSFDMEALHSGIKKLKKGDIYVEVGTQHGRSAYSAFKFMPDGVEMYCVDKTDHGGNPDSWSREEFFHNSGMEWKVVFIHLPSQTAATLWHKPISMIFIDADHSYGGVKADLEGWYPHIKKGGYLYFHDADSGDVLDLMNEMEKDPRFTDRVNYKETQENMTSIVSFKKT